MTLLPLEVSTQYEILSQRQRAQELRHAAILKQVEVEAGKFDEQRKKDKDAQPPLSLLEANSTLSECSTLLNDINKDIDALEQKTIGGATIANVSRGAKGFMVVLQFPDADGKVSITRHLRRDNKNRLTGQSVFNRGIVHYQLSL